MVGIYKAGGGGGGGVLDRRDVLDIMHGRSRMTIDPRIPGMPGRRARWVFTEYVDLLAPIAKRREVLGESHEG